MCVSLLVAIRGHAIRPQHAPQLRNGRPAIRHVEQHVHRERDVDAP